MKKRKNWYRKSLKTFAVNLQNYYRLRAALREEL